MSHTPGPWDFEMVCVSGRGKHSVFRPCVSQKTSGERRGICEVYVTGENGRKATGEDKDNSRLIAAAPELLEEVKNQRNWLRHIRPDIKTRESILLGFDQAEKYLSALIAKAEGRK
jgi:hypothetical protein